MNNTEREGRQNWEKIQTKGWYNNKNERKKKTHRESVQELTNCVAR